MTRHVYFDTCALMRFAEGSVAVPEARNAAGRTTVQNLISGKDILATSEIGLIEFHDALARDVRDGNSPDFTNEWLNAATEEVMRLVATGRVEVISMPPKVVENAMMLMTIAHTGHGVAFHAWDAVHLITALAWAHNNQVLVELATCDSDYPRFFDRFSHFGRYVTILMVA